MPQSDKSCVHVLPPDACNHLSPADYFCDLFFPVWHDGRRFAINATGLKCLHPPAAPVYENEAPTNRKRAGASLPALHCLMDAPDCLIVFKPGAMHPVTTATIKALRVFWISGLWPEFQATRFAGGR
jgi:hypothetical protein